MSLSLRQYYLARPSVSPTTTGASGSLTIAHRRVNTLGQRTALSPFLINTSLPATLTPQSYSDSDSLLRDEFLVSNDGGTTWKLVPVDSDHIGPLAVPAFNESWANTTINGNQSVASFNLDFGSFNSSTNPSQVAYLVNVGSAVNSLTFNFVDLITQLPLTVLAGSIQVEILGIFPSLGNNADNSFNQSFIWDVPQVSLNTVSLVLPQFAFVKLRITILNFPVGGLSNEVFNLSMSVVSNQTSFPLTWPNDWPIGTFKIDGNTPFNKDIVVEVDSSTYQVLPFIFNNNGVLNSQLRTLSLEAQDGDRRLLYTPSGQVIDQPLADPIPSDHTVVATFTMSGGTITNLEYPWPVTPQSYSEFVEDPTIEAYRFVGFDGVSLSYATVTDQIVGVTLFQDSGLVAQTGLIRIQLGGTVSRGDYLIPTTGGKAISSSSGVAIVLEDGVLDDLVIAVLNPFYFSAGSGSVAWGDITGVPSNLTTLEGWTTGQIARAGNLPSATSGTLEKTGADTFGTYTVTAAAKTVLDDATVTAMRATLGAAPTLSPTFTGIPVVPTPSVGTNTTQIASTAFVQSEVNSAVFGEWLLNNYNLSLSSTVDTTPTLISPTVYSGSGFSTSGFTVPTGQGGLYYVEVYAELVGSGANLDTVALGIKRNSSDYFRRNQINFGSGNVAYINTLGSMVFLNAGDIIRPQIRVDFLSGTCNLLNLSFLVHKMNSW